MLTEAHTLGLPALSPAEIVNLCTEVLNHSRCEEVVNRPAAPVKCGHFRPTTPDPAGPILDAKWTRTRSIAASS